MAALPESRRFPTRIAVLLGTVLVLALVFTLVDLSPDLGHVQVRILSGPGTGNYHAIVEELGAAAAREDGRVDNLASAGTVDNLAKLAAAADDCDIHFALAQDGVPAPDDSSLELVARLRKSESMFVLGRSAAELTGFEQLRGKRMGVGPRGSGTDHLARTVFETPDFAALGMTLVNSSLEGQLKGLRDGSLDLGVFVMDEDAPLIGNAIRGGLELARFRHWDVVARKHGFLWHGRIGTGQYDPIGLIPSADVRVLRVDTLVVGNDCASNTETIGLLELLAAQYPELVEHNRSKGRSDIHPTAASAERFLTSWHRFRLWRLDANRDKADEVVRQSLGSKYTAEELQALEPEGKHLTSDVADALDGVIAAYVGLRARCQKQANSMLVPMGQEGAYRYMEDQMEDMLTAVRAFRTKLDDAAAEPQERPDA